MPIDKAIDSAQLDANLTAVADAIRAKGETTEQLVFPGGFVAAIETMETGKTGATLTVTTPSEGITVTVAKGELSYTKTTGADGTAVISGLESGTWTITISDGTQTATGTVDIDADYAANMTFFAATINVTYPTGLVCTATDGVTTLTAPDTSGTWACVVPNVGTWTVSLSNGLSESAEITQDGETQTIDKWYLYKTGDERTSLTGGWVALSKKYLGTSFDNSTPTTITYAPTVTRGAEYLTVIEYKSGDSGNLGVFETSNAINLTNVNTVYFDISGSGNHTKLFIGAANNGSFVSVTEFFSGIMTSNQVINRDVYSVDVSDISGEYNISLMIYNAATGTPMEFRIYNVYMN